MSPVASMPAQQSPIVAALTRLRGTAGIGASSSLPPIPAKVASPSRQRPLRLGDGNRSSCPLRDLPGYACGCLALLIADIQQRLSVGCRRELAQLLLQSIEIHWLGEEIH